MKTVAVIGGGPAGLMAAEVLCGPSVQVDLYEAKPSIGRRFLVAGKGGLNLTHAEPFETLVTRYGARAEQIGSLLSAFGPQDVRNWCHGLGIETFVGSSQRIFPKDQKAFAVLRKWMQRLAEAGVTFHTQHCWQGWNQDGSLSFTTPAGELSIQPDATVLTVGGASWPKLGSDGAWVPVLQQAGCDVAPLRPSNCGFDVSWTEHFRERNSGEPLKSVVLTFTNSGGETFERKGACLITKNGIEGSLIYAASPLIRDEITEHGSAIVTLDLAPDRTVEQLIERLSIPRGSRTVSSHLRSKVRLQGVESGLLREFAADAMSDPVRLAHAIKALPIPLTAARPIDEAISTAGGVRFESLNAELMVESHPGLFCAGEMLDWEAPTGGYLLTACFASGRAAGQGALAWVNRDMSQDVG
jgi:uncharacterized flavoprotein (TIGR03862 family)